MNIARINSEGIITNIEVCEQSWYENQDDKDFLIPYGENDSVEIGGSYSFNEGKFVLVSPHPSWVLDSNLEWQAPVPKPDSPGVWVWFEDELKWVNTEDFSFD